MNKFLITALLITVSAFAQKREIHFNAEFQNPNSDSIVIHNKEFKITIKGDKGKFSGKFEAPKGFYQLFDGAKFANLYLSDGFNLNLTADGKRFDETLSFTGNGALENNYLLQKKANDKKIKESFGNQLPDNDALQNVLDNRFSHAKQQLASNSYEADFPNLMLEEYQRENKEIKAQLDVARGIENGLSELKNKPTPDFEFKNYKGGTTKLSSLKGKIVYIDIWAVWCGPCRAEIPYLKKLEEDFKNQNIDFLSISIDEPKDVEKWKKFVAEKDLKGIQLLADNAWQTEWIKHFKITGIPRFIIIGTDGKVLEPDAPRPSAPEIATTLSNLLK